MAPIFSNLLMIAFLGTMMIQAGESFKISSQRFAFRDGLHMVVGKAPEKYCEDVSRAVRRPTRTVVVGPVKIGSDYPVQKQTMCTTNTKDVEASVEQIVKIAKEGM